MTTAETTVPAFAPLFERHAALFGQWTAALERGDVREGNRLREETNDVLDEIVEAACTSDADFIAKLRYLIKAEYRLNRGAPSVDSDWKSLAVAAFLYLGLDEGR